MRPVVARPDGELEVLGGFRPAARSGGQGRRARRRRADPPPRGHDAHAPARTSGARARRQEPAGRRRGGSAPGGGGAPGRPPAHAPARVAARCPAAAGFLSTATRRWWSTTTSCGSPHSTPTASAGGSRRATRAPASTRRSRRRVQALPGNRLVDHLAICATELRCYTAQNTFLRRYEGALPASPACNADCLGCISLQTDGQAPAPQPRMRFAPTADELAGMADFHLGGADAGHRLVRSGLRGRAADPRRRARRRRRSDPRGASRGDHPRQHQWEPAARPAATHRRGLQQRADQRHLVQRPRLSRLLPAGRVLDRRRHRVRPGHVARGRAGVRQPAHLPRAHRFERRSWIAPRRRSSRWALARSSGDR